jgi:hypothetical protein
MTNSVATTLDELRYQIDSAVIYDDDLVCDRIIEIINEQLSLHRSRLIQRLEKEKREIGNNTLCAYCGEHQASGDCSCGGINVGLDKAITIIKEGTNS